jgi:hypothetical protein
MVTFIMLNGSGCIGSGCILLVGTVARREKEGVDACLLWKFRDAQNYNGFKAHHSTLCNLTIDVIDGHFPFLFIVQMNCAAAKPSL